MSAREEDADIESPLNRAGAEDGSERAALPPETTRPTAPATRPTAPATRPTAPATRPTAPATRPTAPATRPTAPATRPTAPATRPTAPTRAVGPTRTPGPVRGTPRPARDPRLGVGAPPVRNKRSRGSVVKKYCVPITAVVLILASIVVISILIKVVLDNYYLFCLKSFKFIPLDKWCDGESDCAGGEDEQRCVQPAEITTTSQVRLSEAGSVLQLYITSSRSWSLICSDNWESGRAKAVCAQLGFRGDPVSSSVPITNVMNGTPIFSNVQVQSDLGIQVIPIGGRCPSGSVVSLRCSACGASQKRQRIIGGSSTPIQNWPWQVSLQYMGQHVCGGSIVTPRWILSAAHCFPKGQKQVDRWRVQAGVSSLTFTFASFVDKIFVHSLYVAEKQHDIALLRLKADLSLSASLLPVCMPGFDTIVPDDAKLWVTGWGYTAEGGTLASQLQEVAINLISNEICSQEYTGQIHSTMMCAGRITGGVDTCQGDSGGPLVWLGDSSRWDQVGIVSWGDGCGRQGKVGVYTKVTSYLDWIYGVMKLQL